LLNVGFGHRQVGDEEWHQRNPQRSLRPSRASPRQPQNAPKRMAETKPNTTE